MGPSAKAAAADGGALQGGQAEEGEQGGAEVQSMDAAEGEAAGQWQGMQEVLRFLRRSKDAAEMELSLMTQDRLRLQKQVQHLQNQAGPSGSWSACPSCALPIHRRGLLA